MHKNRLTSILLLTVLLLMGIAGCQQEAGEESPAPTSAPPTDVAPLAPTSEPLSETFVTVATTAPYPPFEYFDEFGTVVGYDAELLDTIMSSLGREHEFVVTNFDGLLASVAAGEFDMAVSPFIAPEPVEGIVYSDPYLEVGQVLVVLANERNIQSYTSLTPGTAVGVVGGSFGQRTALEDVGLLETDLEFYDTVGAALQGLIDREVSGVIIDHDDAGQFAETYFQQLKIVGGVGPEAWISSRQHVMAVNAENELLLDQLNAAIAEAIASGATERLTRNWLISGETLEAGESLVGTPADVLVIGVVGQDDGIDPIAGPSRIGWEVRRNVSSGLLMYDAEGNLVPILATGMPTVSADLLEYTFDLRTDLVFPDGTPLTAEDVKWSIDRAASGGNWHINSFLKDSDSDFLADSDAVVVEAPNRVKLVLKEPASYFLSVLATPAYYVANQECYAATDDPGRSCSGIGPYEIIEWEAGNRVQLRRNARLPAGFGSPSIENVQLRFFSDAGSMRDALQLAAIDMAWVGIADNDAGGLRSVPGVLEWEGPITFKSYLVFEHSNPPWDNPTVRQAAAYAIDQDVIAQQVFAGERRPLRSPVPEDVPGHVSSFPARDLEQTRSLMGFLGYSEDNPLEVTLWYLNDGRYTPLEEAYAQAIAAQLEESGVFQVTLEGAPWELYSAQMVACEYPAFLLGWPPLGWPTRFPAAMGWMDYFITNTDLLCSNFASPEMDALVAQLRLLDPLDSAGQLATYEAMQTLWAEQYPTLDLTSDTQSAFGMGNIGNLRFDNMGLLLYEFLTKTPAEGDV